MKYNWKIIGHQKQLTEIEQDILSGNIAHAYLLSGPDGVGKYSVAKKMANILQCENDFCHECSACLQMAKGSQIDTVEMVNDGSSIKIEEVRKLTERMNMTRQSPYKVVLVDSLERMTTEAANSFLKMLEEPPERTVFILTTNNIKQLLPTVVSRVRVIKFGQLPHEVLKGELANIGQDVTEETLNMVSLFAQGKAGKAISLLESPDVLAGYVKIYHQVQNLLGTRNVVDRFAYIDELIEDEAQLENFFAIITAVMRSRMLEEPHDGERYINALSKIQEAGVFLKKNINVKLVLENLMLNI